LGNESFRMRNKVSAKDGQNKSDDTLPKVGVGVRVTHDGRELRAYRNGQGKWRDYNNGDLLAGEVRVIKG